MGKFISYLLFPIFAISSLIVLCGSQNLDDVCVGSFGIHCNDATGLTCGASGRCECRFPWMVYDIKEAVCKVSDGHECDSSTELRCVDDASCVLMSEGNNKQCICNEGFQSIAATSCDGVGFPEEDKDQTRICCLKA